MLKQEKMLKMKLKLKDKIALVTGAGRGIGQGIALRLAEDGANIIVNDIQGDLAKRVADEIMKDSSSFALALPADVSKAREVKKMFEEIFKQFGRIDILVNNAGISDVDPVIKFSEKRWDRIFNMNTKSVFLCSKMAAKYMIKQKKGRIINASSGAGIQALPYLAAYSASKAAIIGFTQALAKELAPYGITVNAYCPGLVPTPLWDWTDEKLGKYYGLKKGECIKKFITNIPLGRAGTPEDIAGLVSFLASDDASWITGQAFCVNGGDLMR